MHKFRLKLALTLILMIACAMVLTGLFVAQMLIKSNEDVLKMALERELEVIISSRVWKNQANLDQAMKFYSSQVKEKVDLLESRLTFVDVEGKVIADSDHDPNSMENHLNRPEFEQAQKVGIGYDKRYSETFKQNMLYVAVPLIEQEQRIGYLRASISLRQVDASLYQLWYSLFGGMLIVFLVTAFFSYRIARTITKPIEKMTEVTQQISKMNVLDRIPITGKDEIADLAKEINFMADSMQLQMNMIRENEGRLKNILSHLISGLMMIDKEQKIVLTNPAAEELIGFPASQLIGKYYYETKQQFEFKKLIEKCLNVKESMHEELLFYYPVERVLDVHMIPIFQPDTSLSSILIVLHDITALRRLERMRSEFVANVSHELKTPLSAVKGFSETLLAGALEDKETARSFIQIIYDESERLNRLITDTLELSKIESKRIPIRFASIHVSSFVAEIFNVMHPEAIKKNIRLTMQVDDNLYLEADPDCLRQILINLIANAINYTGDEGKVTVRVDTTNTSEQQASPIVNIHVIDTGIGIPKKDLTRIFERFYRVDEARARISGGTGLGLAIVKHLIELHNGNIRVQSKIGIGTEFIIQLPRLHGNY